MFRKSIFYLFLILCALVFVMLVQEMFLQAEATNPKSSFFSDISTTFKYYFFLPRTKLRMMIKDIRKNLKSDDSVNTNRSETISNLFADMISKPDYVQYLVFVISAPNKRTTRDLLRNSGYMSYKWLDENGDEVNWKHYFVVGQVEDESVNEAVKLEAKTNPDLLIGSFQDSYKNLVFKTLWLMEWAVTRYDFDALIKCDDDTIVNLSKFKELMERQNLDEPFYGGARFGGMPVFRAGRYEVTKEQWFPDKFPPYCSGGGYVLNKPAITKLLEIRYSNIQPVFLVEDAFMGVLAYHAKIDPVSLIPYFRAFNPHNNCNKDDSTLLHYVKNDFQKDFMDNFRKIGRFCDEKWVEDHRKH